MSVHASPLPPLSQRATKLIEYLSRFSIGILEVLAAIYPDLSAEALRKFLERLTAEGWLVKQQLPGTAGSYWMLTSRACNRLGLKRNASAFRHAPLIRHVLTALYFATNEHLKLLTSSECRDSLPQIYRKGSSNHYFLDVSQPDSLRLGWLLIDDGKKPLRLWSKAREVLSVRKVNPSLYDLCQAGAFHLAIVTAAPAKAQKINTVFQDKPFRDVPVEVHAVGEQISYLLGNGKAGV